MRTTRTKNASKENFYRKANQKHLQKLGRLARMVTRHRHLAIPYFISYHIWERLRQPRPLQPSGPFRWTRVPVAAVAVGGRIGRVEIIGVMLGGDSTPFATGVSSTFFHEKSRQADVVGGGGVGLSGRRHGQRFLEYLQRFVIMIERGDVLVLSLHGRRVAHFGRAARCRDRSCTGLARVRCCHHGSGQDETDQFIAANVRRGWSRRLEPMQNLLAQNLTTDCHAGVRATTVRVHAVFVKLCCDRGRSLKDVPAWVSIQVGDGAGHRLEVVPKILIAGEDGIVAARFFIVDIRCPAAGARRMHGRKMAAATMVGTPIWTSVVSFGHLQIGLDLIMEGSRNLSDQNTMIRNE